MVPEPLPDPELCWDATSDIASDATLPSSRQICVNDLLAAIPVVKVYQTERIITESKRKCIKGLPDRLFPEREIGIQNVIGCPSTKRITAYCFSYRLRLYIERTLVDTTSFWQVPFSSFAAWQQPRRSWELLDIPYWS